MGRDGLGRRTRRLWTAIVGLTLSAVLLGCAPSQAPSAGQAPGQPQAQSPGQAQTPSENATRVLRVLSLGEPDQLSLKPLGASHVYKTVSRMYNAGIGYVDEKGAFHPELVEALPQLNTGTWKVFPDGKMETTYTLRPNLTWHDGHPLTADDFVFGFEAYGGPELGQGRLEPQRRIEEVVAVDPRTVLFRWKEPYADADALASANPPAPMAPLPRHILGDFLKSGSADAFAAQPYWTTEYVGLGPYKLDRWERGAFMEATAFDNYALGRPKITRLRVLFATDPTTMIATLLAGAADMVPDGNLRVEQGMTLRDQWGSSNAGVVEFFTSAFARRADAQLDPARATNRALLSLDVRKGIMSGIDRQSLADVLLYQLGRPADTAVMPDDEFFPAADRVITKFPRDPRRAEQYFADAGYTKGADGVYTHPSDGRLTLNMQYQAGPQFEKEAAIIGDSLKQVGVDYTSQAQTDALRSQVEYAVAFPSLRALGGGSIDSMYGSKRLPTQENRYSGGNRGSWINADYDRIWDAYNVTLDRSQRTQQLIDMAKVVSENLPAFELYYNMAALARPPELQGVIPGSNIGAAWNMHLWEFKAK